MVQGAGGEPQAGAEASDAVTCMFVTSTCLSFHMQEMLFRSIAVTFLWGVSRCIHSHRFFSLDEQGFADRVFYESLLQQRADSHMAQKWCLEHGVLKWAEAETLCKKMGVTFVRGRRDPMASCVIFNMRG